MKENKVIKKLFITVLIFAHSCAMAEPMLVESYSQKSNIASIDGIVGLEEPMSDCSQHIGELTIDEVIYESNSDYIIGFRAKQTKSNPSLPSFSMNTKELYLKLGNAGRLNIQLIIKKAAPVIVTYQKCGSGGFISVRDVFKKNIINK
jgi:hypothetical protein